MLSCFTVHWLWRRFFLGPQRTAGSHGVIMCIASCRFVPAPEPSSQFNWVAESVIEAFSSVFARETLKMIPGDAINVPSGSQVTGQEKRQKIFSSFIFS